MSGRKRWTHLDQMVDSSGGAGRGIAGCDLPAIGAAMPFIKPVDPSERAAYDPSAEEAAYGFEQTFEHTSEGGSDVWIVTDRRRLPGYPVATCDTPEDAMLIVDALNTCEAR